MGDVVNDGCELASYDFTVTWLPAAPPPPLASSVLAAALLALDVELSDDAGLLVALARAAASAALSQPSGGLHCVALVPLWQ